jgi:hypothetical protein
MRHLVSEVGKPCPRHVHTPCPQLLSVKKYGPCAGNAVRMAAVVADAVLSAVPGARLCTMQGGDKRNAIARECRATLAVSERHHEGGAFLGGKL